MNQYSKNKIDVIALLLNHLLDQANKKSRARLNYNT